MRNAAGGRRLAVGPLYLFAIFTLVATEKRLTIGRMGRPRRCPLCRALLRQGNEGPFCSSKECTRAQFALQAYLANELKGALTTVKIDLVERDSLGIYTVWCEYPEKRRGELISLQGVRYNQDGIGMGQHVTLSAGEGR
jgi:hypothetical protein